MYMYSMLFYSGFVEAESTGFILMTEDVLQVIVGTVFGKLVLITVHPLVGKRTAFTFKMVLA